MGFDEDKTRYMEVLYSGDDRSKKGKVDDKIVPLLEAINAKENYYTTSSCSGRILVYTKTRKKCDARWLFVSHDTIEDVDIKDLPDEEVWFKQESFIIHVVARTLEDAEKLFRVFREYGIKRTGIQSTKKGFVVEILNHVGFELPIAINRKLIVDKDYFKKIMEIANKNMKLNEEKIKKITRVF